MSNNLIFDKRMDNIVESSVVEDFDNPPSKKIKCSEPDFSDPITSPASLQSSEIDDDQQLEDDKQIKVNSDPITSPASPSLQKLSPIIELEDKQASEIDDDQQLEDKQIKVDTYDYVPQDKQMAEKQV